MNQESIVLGILFLLILLGIAIMCQKYQDIENFRGRKYRKYHRHW